VRIVKDDSGCLLEPNGMKSSQQDRLGVGLDTVRGAGASQSPLSSTSRLESSARSSIFNACHRLLTEQHRDGYWCGELQGDSMLTSEYILLMAFLEREKTEAAKKAACYLLQEQNADGGWSAYPGGGVDVNVSVKAYFALKLTGHAEQAEYMLRARRAILEAGGADCVNSFTRYYLAMLGQINYAQCPAIAPEVMLLPNWFPINIYRVSAWSRTILVPLSIVWSKRPTRQVDPECGMSELFCQNTKNWQPARYVDLGSSSHPLGWESLFRWMDQGVKWFERHNCTPWRRRAVHVAQEWMIKRFVASDGLGAIFPSIVWSIVALKSLGYEDQSLELRYCNEQLQGLIIEGKDTIRLQPCKSPVWDTAISLRALAKTGIKSSQVAVRRAVSWLLSKEVTRRGDWAETVDAELGGWFFEHHNDFYPDTDDTAMVTMALAEQFADSRWDDSNAPSGVSFIAAERATDLADAKEQTKLLEEAAVACDRGRRWILAMQNKDGGWGAFDRNNNAGFLCHVPFADHNAMIDPSTPDLTGRVLEMLGKLGARVGHPAVDRAISYLRMAQSPDGSWYGRWGVNYIYGTWQALVGLRAVGITVDDQAMVTGSRWLLSCQQKSGGWGESPESYANLATKGQGQVTASQTAWALMGLVAAGFARDSSVIRGIQYLLETQSKDGMWQETNFTGTGFPRVFYLRYHMYPLYFPSLAIANWLESKEPPEG